MAAVVSRAAALLAGSTLWARSAGAQGTLPPSEYDAT